MIEQLKKSWQKMIEHLLDWVDIFINNLPNLLFAILIMVLAYWVSVLVRRSMRKPLNKLVREESVRTLISSAFSLVIISVGLLLAIAILNLDTVLKSILAGAGIVGLAVGLALQGPLSNTFSGIFLAVKDVISVGDYIQTNGYSGVVTDISLRMTKLKEGDNNLVVIPNKQVLETPFKNFGLTRRMRVSFDCAIAYDTDLDQVEEIAIEAINEVFPQQSNEGVEFYFTEFADFAINIKIRFYAPATRNRSNIEKKSKAIKALKQAFDKHGIEIPFPIRTIDIRSGKDVLDEENSTNS